MLVFSNRNEGDADRPDKRVTQESQNRVLWQPVLLRISSSVDESDILNSLAALHDIGYRITFTWCPSHCGIVWNEMTDEKIRKGFAVNQGRVRHHYDSAKATIRHAIRGYDISHEKNRRVHGAKGVELDHIK